MTKQQKRTPKKKSAPSSRTSKQSEIRIFDVPGAKVIGRVLRTTPTAFIVGWLGQLSFRPVPLKGGEAFNILASISNPLTPELYELERAGVRGSYVNDSVNVELLYDEYVTRCKAGEYHLNPFAAPAQSVLQQGDGTADAPETAVSMVKANEPAPTQEEVAEPAPEAPITDDAPAASAEVPSNGA
jgi:hypothetical protein